MAMPHHHHRSGDSGYGSTQAIDMAPQGSGISQPFYTRSGDPLNSYMPSQFPPKYRDAQSSTSGLDSVADPTFHSSMDFSLHDDIDPHLRGSPALLGITGQDHMTSSQFTLEDQETTVDISRAAPFEEHRQADQTFTLPTEDDTSAHPWNTFQVETMMNGQQSRYLPSQNNTHKRVRPNSTDPGYGSQDQNTSSLFSASPTAPMQQFNTSFYQQRRFFSIAPDFNDERGPSYQRQQQHPQPHYDQRVEPTSNRAANRTPQVRATAKAPRQPRNQVRKYECDFCLPGDKVFRTINDLDRHLKTVHAIIKSGERVWKCGVPNCPVTDKIWPRLDNFKQHVVRMHSRLYADAAEDMSVLYDPAVHGTIESSRNAKSSSQTHRVSRDTNTNLPPDAISFTPGASGFQTTLEPHSSPQWNTAETYVQQRRATPRSLIGQAPPSANTSMIRNGQRSNSISSIGGNMPTYLATPQLASPNTGLGLPGQKSGARTVANHTTMLRQRREMLEQDNTLYPPASLPTSNADFGAMGEHFRTGQSATLNPAHLLTENVEAVSESDTLNLAPAESQSLNPMDTACKELHKSLTPDQQKRLRLIIEGLQAAFARPAGQNMSMAPEPSSIGKKADREQEEKTYKCLDRVTEKHVERPCGKSFDKKSELNKHRNRHLRRYGCTFDHCYKRFGTKWEWKRHEHNQHVQLESWRCRQSISASDKPCADLFHDKNDFRAHIQQQHRVVDADAVILEIEACHLAKKWLGSFWCGFCSTIVKSNASFGKDMYRERNEHVSKHIDGEDGTGLKRNMWDWIELAGKGKTKKKMKRRDQQGSLKLDPNQVPDVSHDEDDDTSSGDEQESPIEPEASSLRSQPQRPNVSVALTEPEPAIGIPEQHRRKSSATTPTLRVTSPAGEISAPGTDERHRSVRQRGRTKPTHDAFLHQQSKVCCQCYTQTSVRLGLSRCRNCPHHYCPSCGLQGPQQHAIRQAQQQTQPAYADNSYANTINDMELDEMFQDYD